VAIGIDGAAEWTWMAFGVGRRRCGAASTFARSARKVDPVRPVTTFEMKPRPEELWVPDTRGNRRTCRPRVIPSEW